MNEKQAKIFVSKLCKMPLQNHSLSEKREVHMGQSAWSDIWYGLYLGNIEETEKNF